MGQKMTVAVNGSTITVRIGAGGRRHCILFFSLILVALLVTVPTVASAWNALDPIGSLVTDALNPLCKFLWGVQAGIIHNMGVSGVLTAPFDSLLGSLGGDKLPGLKDFVKGISDVGVKPVAASLFSLSILAQFMKIAQRMDQNQTVPALKEIVMLFVFCVIYMYLIRNGFNIMGDLYDLVGGIDVDESFKDLAIGTDEFIDKIFDGIDVGGALAWVGAMIISTIIAAKTWITITVAAWGLAIQVYVMAAFAPLAFAFFSYDGTRQWALGYLRNFLSLALTMVILLIILYCFPFLFNAINDWNNVTVDSFIAPIKYIACLMLLSKAVTSAGQWAQGVFGG